MGEPDGTAEATNPATAGLTSKVANKVGKRVDGFFSRRIEGAKSLLQHVEEKKGEITSKLLESHAPTVSDEKARETSDSSKKQVVESVDGFLSRRIEGAKQLLHDVEEKKGKYFSSKVVSSDATDQNSNSNSFGSSESADNQAVQTVGGFLSTRVAGAKQLLHNVEEKKDQILSKVFDSSSSLTQFSGRADSVTKPTPAENSKSLGSSSESAQNQPLLENSEQPTPWWQSCCGLVDLLKNSGK